MDDILDFDQQIAEAFTDTNPPVAFRFHGQVFKAHGDGPGLVLLNFVRAAIREDGKATADAMLDFLAACMPSDEYTRFTAICNDPDIVTPVEHLAIVVRGLLSKYNDRPTGPSSNSPVGPAKTKRGSKGGSSVAASGSAD